MSRNPLEPEKDEPYQRPHGGWICGDAARGNACPLGPSHQGICSKKSDCAPIFRDGRWYCGKAAMFGGPCQHGPSPDGQCGGPIRNCSPKKKFRRLRGEIVFACSALTLGVILVLFNAQTKQEFLAPGPLTDSHALLLRETAGDNRCAACHPEANGDFTTWASSLLVSKPSHALNQSDLCLNCHRESLGESALQPHGVTSTQLASIGSGRGRTAPTNHRGELACSTCHREHHGAKFDLTSLSNQQCNNCHDRDFDSFANGHPEFDRWPTHKPAIRAAHQAHFNKHFPEAKQNYSCRRCHQPGGKEEVVPIVGYNACASCHSEKLATNVAEGVTLVSYPMLDIDLLRDEEPTDLIWPEQAQGGFDGPIPPLMRLLLLGDPLIADEMADVAEDFDFLDIDPDDDSQLAFCHSFLMAVRRLSVELGRDARGTVTKRLTKALGQSPPDSIVDSLLSGLPRTFMRDTLKRLHSDQTRTASNVSSASDLDETRDMGSEELNEIRGWFCDWVTAAIIYRPTEHADPVLKSLVELSVTPLSRTASPAARQTIHMIRNSHIVAQCTSCHVSEVVAGQVSWKNESSNHDARKFTKFSHRPHLVQPQLRNCQECHAWTASDSQASASTVESLLGHQEFAPITKSACASCHVPKAAGDGCTKCHNYHVTPPTPSHKAILTADALQENVARMRELQ